MEECLRQRESGTGLRCGLRRRLRQTRASVLTDSVLAAPVDAELSLNAVELLDPRTTSQVAAQAATVRDFCSGAAGNETSSREHMAGPGTEQKRPQAGLDVL